MLTVRVESLTWISHEHYFNLAKAGGENQWGEEKNIGMIFLKQARPGGAGMELFPIKVAVRPGKV